MLTKPRNIFSKILRYLGIIKRININNYSDYNVRIINNILVKKGRCEKIYISGKIYEITLIVFIDEHWHILYKDKDFDIRKDLNIFNGDIELAKNNHIVNI